VHAPLVSTTPEDVTDDLVAALTRTVVLIERTPEPDRILLADLFAALARLEGARGRPGPGIAWARGAVATREETLGAEHPGVARDLSELGDLYRLAGRLEDAVEAHRRARAVAQGRQEV
jgi:hypothetical protein